MKIVTHNGRFHVDDVFAVATVLMVYPGAEVVRSRDEQIIKSADIVVDVGLSYDPDLNRFDHHQLNGAGVRNNGIPYSSFGLVWKKWGRELAGEEESKIIDQKLVCPIDANDNAMRISENKFPGIREYTIYDVISTYSEENGFSEEVFLEKFLEAVGIAKGIIRREINIARREMVETKEVLDVVKNSQDKRFVVLNKSLIWLKALASVPETFYVVYPRKDNTWGVQAVPQDLFNSFFTQRKPFPESWGGKTNDELATITGVKDAFFCHSNLYLCAAKTRDGATALAKKAVDA